MQPEPTLNQRELDRLVATYQRAQRRILAEFDDATDFGQARRAEQLARIDGILREVGTETGTWIDNNMPAAYQRGTGAALTQLDAIRVGVKDSDLMSIPDRAAVAALSSETQEAFAQSLSTVGRSANKALSDAAKEVIRQELAEGSVLGATRREISGRIKAAIRKEGVIALIDKSGKRWTLDNYARMLARTKMVEARNTGLANKMVSNGLDLVEVSDHASDHKECAYWEGKILSLTGKTDGYPTLARARSNGLFHPQCEHQINVIRKNHAAMTTAYDPRSRTYKQPFAKNPPKAPTRPLRPIGTPKAAKAGNSVTVIDPRGKGGKYNLSDFERDYIASSGLRIYGSSKPVQSRWGANTQGFYAHRTHSLHIRHPGTKASNSTFYHELGHALDFGNGKMHRRPDVVAAIAADKRAVLINRMYRNYDGKYSMADITRMVDGERVSVKFMQRGVERSGYIAIQGRFKTYVNSPVEVFADAYGQYRLDPAGFAKVAPNLAEIFKRYMT